LLNWLHIQADCPKLTRSGSSKAIPASAKLVILLIALALPRPEIHWEDDLPSEFDGDFVYQFLDKPYFSML
jgi:hypothetical protein